MVNLWSLLVQVILTERFFCDEPSSLMKLRLAKVQLSQSLLGPTWQAKILSYPEVWFDLVYIEFDSNMNVQRITFDAGGDIKREKFQTEDERIKLVLLAASSSASQIKLISARKLDADLVLESFRIHREANFELKPQDEEEKSPFPLPAWVRKLRKFYRDPLLFLKDSNITWFKILANKLERKI